MVGRNSRGISLDAGCGKGVYLNLFNGNVVGLDLDLCLLKERKNPRQENIFLINADLRFIPFKRDVFDYVLCSEVIEHLYESDVEKVIHRFDEIVKYGGIIQISTPNTHFLNESLRRALSVLSTDRQQKFDILEYHRSFWTKQKLQRMGFSVKGCLSYWGRKLFPKFISDLCDIIFWNFPTLAGTLIATKIVKNSRRNPCSR